MRVAIHPTAPIRGCCFIVKTGAPPITSGSMLITLPSFMLEHFSLYPKKTIQAIIVRRASGIG